jgi:hypothetical protein
MNIQASTPAAGVPVVNQALEPSWVRHGSASTQRAYEAALSFEQALVEQLTRSLAATSGLDGESSGEGEAPGAEGGSPSASANSGELSAMLPQALTSGLMNAGGLGLAAQLTEGLRGAQGSAPAPAGQAGQAGIAGHAQTTAPAVDGASGGTDTASTGGSAS